MSFPTVFNIGGHQVCVKRDVATDLLLERSNGLMEFDEKTWEIRVRTTLEDSFAKQCIVYVVIKACFYLAHSEDPVLTKEIIRKVCLALENPLYRFLVDNDLGWIKAHTIPKSLNIGGHDVPIIMDKDTDALLKRACEGRGALAEFDQNLWLIRMKTGLGTSYYTEVIMHEATHGFFHVAHDSDIELTWEIKEKACMALENPLYRFLLENDMSWVKPDAQPKAAK